MKNALHSGVNIVKCLRTPGFPLRGSEEKSVLKQTENVQE